MNVENTNHLIMHLAVLQWVLLDTMHSESDWHPRDLIHKHPNSYLYMYFLCDSTRVQMFYFLNKIHDTVSTIVHLLISETDILDQEIYVN